ncbi:VOC family protein [Occultella aeris]|uniref:Glyoxalase-like domain protein n=1 Tax=Occultella aeris TaxID=2761496 RepID=A0A7M4DNT0_9MICO|nr:VOC family protein [Occultella aeris]VZO39111.1 Glyoxalase-like domain protein [Occultella aeris]
MTQTPRITLTTVNLSSPDPGALASFYAELLGWEVDRVEETDAYLRNPDGGVHLSFQLEEVYTRPVWPATPGEQEMMIHLDIWVDDLNAGVARAVSVGATLAPFQPQQDVRVCLDPHGHPFCLWTD